MSGRTISSRPAESACLRTAPPVPDQRRTGSAKVEAGAHGSHCGGLRGRRPDRRSYGRHATADRQQTQHSALDRDMDLGCAHQDKAKLLQALLNLISNAAKFTENGDITLKVDRLVQEGVEHLHLSVRDTGIGVPADKLGKIFEEFGQADDSTSRNYGGTGLGLPISRSLCQLLGGDLTAVSEPEVGSTFTINVR